MKGSITFRFGGDPDDDKLLNACDHIEGQIRHTSQTSRLLNRRRPDVIVTCSYPGCNLIYSGHDPMASSVMIDGFELHFCWQHTTTKEEPKLFCACGECDQPLVDRDRKSEVLPWTLSKDAVRIDGQVWSRECLSEKLAATQRLNEVMLMEVA